MKTDKASWEEDYKSLPTRAARKGQSIDKRLVLPNKGAGGPSGNHSERLGPWRPRRPWLSGPLGPLPLWEELSLFFNKLSPILCSRTQDPRNPSVCSPDSDPQL